MMIADKLKTIAGRQLLYDVGKNVIDNMEWATQHKEDVEHCLTAKGALLIRGLKPVNDDSVGALLSTLFGAELCSYTYRSTPRRELKSNIYTATEYHPSEIIPQHNEHAYANSWPLRIGFLCVTPAQKMGNTPISDSREAYQLIPQDIREEFERKKIMYVRNYSDIDLPWTDVFQTKDRSIVEVYCKNNNIHFQWRSEGLHTWQINQASLSHPFTGEMLWFNQAHLFHVSSLEKELQEDLISLLGEENLPRNTYFGDGTPIDPQYLDIIRGVYTQTMFSFNWEVNDLLLLDNMLFTHGREPYEGPRKVLVGMAREYTPL